MEGKESNSQYLPKRIHKTNLDFSAELFISI